jgi:methylglutamate dehydrogenase subunit D
MENDCVSETLQPIAAARLPSGRYGCEDGPAGVRLRIISGRALVQVMARGRNDDSIESAVREKYDIALPKRPVIARGARLSFLWAGHRAWIAMADERNIADLESVLRDDLGSLVSISDQSDGRLLLEVRGGNVRDMLARLAPIDLHPRAFRPDDTALTLFGHIAGQITQIDAAPVYELMVFRGFAESLLQDVMAYGAQFGVEVSANSGVR